MHHILISTFTILIENYTQNYPNPMNTKYRYFEFFAYILVHFFSLLGAPTVFLKTLHQLLSACYSLCKALISIEKYFISLLETK